MSDLQRIRKLINGLKDGTPMGDLDTFGLKRELGGDVGNAFRDAVINSTREGAQNTGHITSFTATYGGGKSETLASFEQILGAATFQNENKLVLVRLDLNAQVNWTRAGIPVSIFKSVAPLNQTVEADNTREALLKSNFTDHQRERIGAIGLDILAGMSGIPFFASSIVGPPIRWISGKTQLREAALVKRIRKNGIDSDDTARLLALWARYSILAGQAQWDELDRFIQLLAERDRLFYCLCEALVAFDYVTIVLLVDQAEKKHEEGLHQSFVNLKDQGRTTGINMFFVLAQVPIERNSERSAYSRRFEDGMESLRLQGGLNRPNLSGGPDDDLIRVRPQLARIAALNQEFDWLRFEDNVLETTRAKLNQLEHQGERRQAEWSDFWQTLLSEAERRAQ